MVHVGQVTEMRPVVPEWYNDIYATCKLGFVWMAFDGMPTSSHPKYRDADVRENGMRVRQLMSPEQMQSERWKEFFENNNGSPADGSEPLAYTYCSSGCNAAPVPDLIDAGLESEMAKLVNESCENAPSDIGQELARIVRNHLGRALD